MYRHVICLIVFSFSFSLLAEHAAENTNIRTRPYLSLKDIKVQTLKSKVSDFEIRIKELELESFKAERNVPDTRSASTIQKEVSSLQTRLQVIQVELAITEKMYSDQCKAVFGVQQRRVAQRDFDTGDVTGHNEITYLVCNTVADTCSKDSYPLALVSTFGSDQYEVELRNLNDSRIGKDCYCHCKSRRSSDE